MNADGTGQVGLGTGGYFASRPAWSPDGSKIVFERGRVIVVMNADGTNQTEVTVNTTGFDTRARMVPGRAVHRVPQGARHRPARKASR